VSLAEAKAKCCANLECAGFSYPNPGTKQGGFYKGNAMGGFQKTAGYEGYTKPNQIVHGPPPPPAPSPPAAADITLDFALVDLHGAVEVFDIWQEKSLGSFTGSYTANQVPKHGTAFLRLSTA
jgi:hypothetical protein